MQTRHNYFGFVVVTLAILFVFLVLFPVEAWGTAPTANAQAAATWFAPTPPPPDTKPPATKPPAETKIPPEVLTEVARPKTEEPGGGQSTSGSPTVTPDWAGTQTTTAQTATYAAQATLTVQFAATQTQARELTEAAGGNLTAVARLTERAATEKAADSAIRAFNTQTSIAKTQAATANVTLTPEPTRTARATPTRVEITPTHTATPTPPPAAGVGDNQLWLLIGGIGVVVFTVLSIIAMGIFLLVRGRAPAAPRAALIAGRAPRLVATVPTGSLTQTSIAFPINRSPTLIGRGKGCAIQIPATLPAADTVSRQHARFELRGERWVIVDGAQDKPSANGIYVNGKRTRENFIENGDSIAIGKVEFKFTL